MLNAQRPTPSESIFEPKPINISWPAQRPTPSRSRRANGPIRKPLGETLAIDISNAQRPTPRIIDALLDGTLEGQGEGVVFAVISQRRAIEGSSRFHTELYDTYGGSPEILGAI